VTVVYLDSSALVKLVVTEPESSALMEFLLRQSDRVSSAVVLAEVPRALRRAGKLDVVAITAVARELAAFIWAVGMAVGSGRTPEV
jgi:predicted nucleic acid-binding protein